MELYSNSSHYLKIMGFLVKYIYEFVEAISECPIDVDVTSERYVVNGKSIMGVFSLNLFEPVVVFPHGDIPEDVMQKIKKFEVEE